MKAQMSSQPCALAALALLPACLQQKVSILPRRVYRLISLAFPLLLPEFHPIIRLQRLCVLAVAACTSI